MPDRSTRQPDEQRAAGLPGAPPGDGGRPGSQGSVFSAPQISFPKGGGALRGIGETFSADLLTGTGSLKVPIALTPGRPGGGPQLSLAYDSGNGNGPFGFGWHLPLPSVTRRTDKGGLPRYDDAPRMEDTRNTDIFVLSGAEDLVPVLEGENRCEWRVPTGLERKGYEVQAYRPRTEGLFARIERWTRLADGDIHWRSISTGNVLTVYGLDGNSRIADPDDPLRIFTWLISRTYDDHGQAVAYDYTPEDGCGVDVSLPSEKRRRRGANRYLRRIRWGNRTPQLLDPGSPSFRACHLDAPNPDDEQWMFSAVCDYGEGRYEAMAPDPDGRVLATAGVQPQHAWDARPDPFSSYRAGFEVRTHRLCRRILMFHHFEEEMGTPDCLVGSTAFSYRKRPFGSFLETVEQCGHVRQQDNRYLTRALPRLSLSYTRSPLEDGESRDLEVRDMDEAGLRDLPGGVSGTCRWLDLDGEGIPGVLADEGGAWLFKRNLGKGRLSPAKTVPLRPSLASIAGPLMHLMDIDGDGMVDVVELSPLSPGFHGRDADGSWRPFTAFRSVPVIDWTDPDLRFIDLTGDGIADILITCDGAFDWRPSLLEDGFGTARRVHVPAEEEETGPRLLLSDAAGTVFLADMSGDGLTDLVRIRNGEVCYWPNLGYGRFGAKVTMARAPWFDEPDLFDPGRIRLADVDGSGTTDIVYLGRDGARVYLNGSGNGWSTGSRIAGWPAEDNVVAVDVLDLLGRGTSCLVWSSPLPCNAGRQVRYVDLMDGCKPHLLCGIDNNMGATRRIDYASSTEFYLADKAAGEPWVTRLPIPVHTVRRVETWDAVSRTLLVTRYSYHHGYYDGLEREFRGFGRVEQVDTEETESLTGPPGEWPAGNWDAASSVPPVVTRTWFHTGVFPGGGSVSRHLAHEYFGGGDQTLPDTQLPDGLTPFEAREACCALKGAMLRREIYARDGIEAAGVPYAVDEHNYTVVKVQPRGMNRYASFFTHPRESISLHYERNAADPRIGHELTLAVDEWGNVLGSASLGYARRIPEAEEQARALATLTERRFTNPVLLPDAHRAPSPAQETTFELTAPVIAGATPLGFDTVAMLAGAAAEVPYTVVRRAGPFEKRLVARGRTVYRANNLDTLLPDGVQEALALPGETFTLALTDELLELIDGKEPAEVLAGVLTSRHGGYAEIGGAYWLPSGRVFYAAAADTPPGQELTEALRHFFLPHRYCDPFGRDTVVGYDPYDLAPAITRDAAGNVTRAWFDYRVVAAHRIADPNGNRSEARFDALGLLAGTAVAGKAEGPIEGDSFDDFAADLTPAELTRYFDARDPAAMARAALGTATTRLVYDFTRQPVCSASIARETHVSALAPGQQTRVQLRFVYSDGFGREAQTRGQAEPGPLDPARPEDGEVSPRWVATGAKVYNNKGNPVRQYEPFFSATPQFGIERRGVSSILFYDPLDRVVATLHPDRTWDKVVFDAWSQANYDGNDTVLSDPAEDEDVRGYFRRLPDLDYLPGWYAQRIHGARGPLEQDAARKTARHADTPTRLHFDVLGRAFLSIADNGTAADGSRQLYATRKVLDIKGAATAVIDALGRTVTRDDYDISGAKLRTRSMEAGTRWTLPDAADKPILAWNSRGYAFRTEYDALHRPVRSFVRGGDPGQPDQHFRHEILFEETVYGDGPRTGLGEAEREARNLRGRVFAHSDGAGVLRTGSYDFKGNALESSRQFARDFTAVPDWSQPVALEAERFDTASTYDALNRVVEATAPDGSVYRPTFNDASLLERVEVNLRGERRHGERTWTAFVEFINYDAKGRRTVISYANGARTHYDYEELTFRLTRLRTTRKAGCESKAARIFREPGCVQDLHYNYDPVGNITHIEDRALRVVHHGNSRAAPENDYLYDPLYRLLEAIGREHKGQAALSFAPPDGNYRDFPFVGAGHLHDLEALRCYRENYDYDPVGNIVRMAHRAAGGGWERRYHYGEPSQLEPGRASNRLSRTAIDSGPVTLVERYCHDAHGNMTEMPHLPVMGWDFRDQLWASSRQVAERGERETTRYVYDASGQRARKITLRADGRPRRERLYIGGFEVFREYGPKGATELERQTLHVMDDVQLIALVETQVSKDCKPLDCQQPVSRFQLTDHLGSTSLELDYRGALLTYEVFGPYGISNFQAGCTAEVSLKRYRHTGKERDDESGFTYHGARYYAPWLGRWTSADPVFKPGFSNAYQYARSNPIVFYDPTGRDWTKFWGGVRAAGGAIQAVGGVAFAAVTAETGVGVALGIAVAAHGLSDYEAGIRQMQTGKEATSITEIAISSGLKAVKVDPDKADAAAKAADITLGFVNPSGPISGGPRAAMALASGGQRVLAGAQVVPKLAAASGAVHGLGATHTLMTAHGDGGGSSDKPNDTGGKSAEPEPQKPPEEPPAPNQGKPTGPSTPKSEAATASSLPTLKPGETLTKYADKDAGLMAQLGKDDRFLNLYIVKGENTPRGGEMFWEAIKAFGLENIRGVRGTWIGGGKLADNFDAYKKAIAAGMTPEKAAFETFTGKMAMKAGFTKANIVTDTAGKVVAEFTR
jgi:RHS repeat-associated protein